MSKQSFLPNIYSKKTDREKRGEKREILIEKAEIIEQRKLFKLTQEKELEERAIATAKENEEQRQRTLSAAFIRLDKLNPSLSAHTNFHGVVETATFYGIPYSSLRDNYIAHRKKQLVISQPIAAVDPDIFFTTTCRSLCNW